MNKKIREALQKSIDNIQENNDGLTLLLATYATKLGKAIGYKHREKSFYRILVNTNNKEYDMYDLLEEK